MLTGFYIVHVFAQICIEKAHSRPQEEHNSSGNILQFISHMPFPKYFLL